MSILIVGVKQHFNKNLIMSVEEEKEFEKSEICWICGKIIDDNNIRDHYISLENIEELLIGNVILIFK